LSRKRPIFDALLSEIITAAKASPGSGADRSLGKERPQDTATEISALSKIDYGKALRRCLSRAEVQELVELGRKRVWPLLNRQPLELLTPSEFARRWAGLGVDFRTADWTWPEGMALLGVYIRKAEGVINRPVICINTAHHPLMVGAAYDHEMGHHVTAELFDSHPESAHFLTYTGYGDHLTDPAELAPDVMVSLAGYPQAHARKLFEVRAKARGRREGEAGDQFEKATQYIANHYGLNFSAKFATEKKLQCLAALIHYTRLRQALLNEYGI
jgi:hypothetical protein